MKALHLSRLISATRLSVDEHPEKSWRIFPSLPEVKLSFQLPQLSGFPLKLVRFHLTFQSNDNSSGDRSSLQQKKWQQLFRLDNQNVGEDIVQNSFLDALVLLFFYSVSQMSLSADSRVFKSQWQIIVLLHLNDSVPSIFTASKKTHKIRWRLEDNKEN